MAQPLGPWRAPSPNPPSSRRRLLVWVGIVVAFGLAIWALDRAFPGAIRNQADAARLAYTAAWGALLASGVILSRRISVGQTLRYIAMWLGVIAVIVIAYVLKNPAQDALLRLRAELIPGYAIETGRHELTINADEDGNFDAFGQVNGATVRFTVDTGASEIVLSPADAARAGIDTTALVYNNQYETANGTGRGAA